MAAPVKPETAEEKLVKPSAIQRGAAAAREAVATGQQANELEEPEIAEKPAKTVTIDLGGEGKPPSVVEEEETPPVKPGEEQEEEEEQKEGETKEGEEEQQPEAIVIALPELRRGQDPIELEVDEQEVADAINALIKGNARRDQFNRAMEDVQTQREELATVEDMLLVDPVNFVIDHVNPQVRTQIALHLMSLPEVYEEVVKQFTGPEGEEVDREKIALRLRSERTERKSESVPEIQARANARSQGRIIANAVEQMIPDTFEDDDAASLRDDMLRDLRDYVDQNNVTSLRPDELPGILERRLLQYGIEPEEAAELLSANAPAPIRGRSPSRSTAGGKNGGAPARSAGQRFKQGAENRRRAAAVPGTGAGAPPTRITLPAGQTIEQRVASMRETFGIPKK